MPFSIPDFPTLKFNTAALSDEYSTVVHRYKVVDNSNKSTSTAQNSLTELITRTGVVINCNKSGRDTQRDVFNQLVTELQPFVENKTEIQRNNNKKATYILLGALLHRYFRIQKEKSLFGFFKDPNGSDLYQSIRQALKLDIAIKTDNIDLDLKKLDPTTTVTALEAFKNFMTTPVNETPRYNTYAHFLQKDPNFITHLDEILKIHRERDPQVLKQFAAIQFLESVNEQMDLEQQQIEAELKKWGVQLLKDYPDFSKLTQEALEAHGEKFIKSEPIREKIFDLIVIPKILKNFQKMSPQQFIADLCSASMDKASNLVAGGYALLLQSPMVTEKLKFKLAKALGHDQAADIKAEQRLLVLGYLKGHLKKYPEITIDCEFFGSRYSFDSEISNVEIELNTVVVENRNAQVIQVVTDVASTACI